MKIHEITPENDMRYRGPLHYQHFQILGWLCIVLSQAVVILKLGGKLDSSIAADTAGLMGILSQVTDLSLPFLLIANFARILNESEGYRNQLIKNAVAAAALCGAFYLFFYRYLIGGMEALVTDPAEVVPAVQSVLSGKLSFGFISFNLFVDLLLCTLVMFFLNYRPSRVFRGKWIHVFRLFTILPIGYEIACMILKVQTAKGNIRMPVWSFPLLPVKPPMTFVLFVILAVFVKTRELRFRRHGKTHQEYKAFLKTRRNSWNFSVFLAVMMVVVSLADLGIVMAFSLNEGLSSFLSEMPAAQTEQQQTPETAAAEAQSQVTAPDSSAVETQSQIATPNSSAAEAQSQSYVIKGTGAVVDFSQSGLSTQTSAAIVRGAIIALAVGFGGSVNLAVLSPLVLLFSYTRIPKNRKIGMLIPAAGAILIFFLYLEGFRAALYRLPIKKLNLNEIREYTAIFTNTLK